jgi:O-antigen ligase
MTTTRNILPGNTGASWLLPLGVVMVAVFAGLATAVVAGRAGMKAVYYAAVFGALGIGALIALTRDEPVRLGWLALFLGFPGRIGLKIFDVVMITIALILLVQRLVASAPDRKPIFPGRSMSYAWALSIPCVVFSTFPGISVQIFLVNVGVYAFFLMSLREMQRDGGFERMTTILAVVMLMMSAGLFIDYFFHINLSLRGSNLNQFSYLGGMEIWRAGGFFQDPQTAGAFLACTITFMWLLLIRGRFSGTAQRYLAAVAVAIGFAAMLTTISRGAIISCVLVSVLALFVFNRWSAPVKLLLSGLLVMIVAVLAMTPIDTLLRLLPAVVAERFSDLGESFDDRLMIWFDTWEMFADNPMTGIGLGTFRPYLLETRPGVVNYYGIGLLSGVPYVPDQPENGYLKILYEGGIFGALAALILIGDALRRAIRVIRWHPPTSHARTEGIAALGALVTFGITFVTLFTWTDSRISALFTMLIAVVWWRSLQIEQRRRAGLV